MEVRHGVPLAELTTVRVGGPAADLVTVDDRATLREALLTVGRPLLVVGGGSNLVVADEGFPGTVVRVALPGLRAAADGDSTVVTAEAGVDWDDLVAWTVAEGWTGLEALSGIPGLVGATPVQNVGAYGCEVADLLETVEVMDRTSGRTRTLDPAGCGFGYRTSRFKRRPDDDVVVAVTLRLAVAAPVPVRYAELAAALGVAPGAPAPAPRVRQAVLELRRAKGMVLDASDHDTWSTGSFFTNPVLDRARAERLPPDAPRYPAPQGRVKTSAAWLIEQAGFEKGYGGRLTGGRATLSRKHTLAVTNRGGASTADLLAVARTVRAGVRDRFGIDLEPEPTLVGCAL